MPIFLTNMQQAVNVTEDLEELLNDVLNTAMAAEDVDLASEVSLVFVDDKYIQNLNLEYRGLDKPTDVLSFAMQEDSDDEPTILGEQEETPILGDIIISMETAVRQAEEYDHSLEREVAFLAVHGMFHLLGYDHQGEEDTKEMRQREEAILSAMNLMR